MKHIYTILIIALILSIAVGCESQPQEEEPKYDIRNYSNMLIFDGDFIAIYERAKSAAFARIDTLDETDFLSPEECSLTIFEDKSAAFLLRTIEKPDIEDNSILVTFSYIPDEKAWQRKSIIYNGIDYGN